MNWESLLGSVNVGNDLHFVTGDKDYRSILNADLFNSFLIDEWEEENESKVIFYSRLSEFFKDKYPEIKLATELEKELLIVRLRDSNNFDETHSAVGRLVKHEDFTLSEKEAVLEAVVSHSQIYWILKDPDVNRLV